MPKKSASDVKESSEMSAVHSTRVASGIPGLDKLMAGGFIPGDIYLVTGGTGTGKTIFCSQFIMEGLQKGEKCLFISLEELPHDIVEDSKIFGWDFTEHIDKGNLILDYKEPYEILNIVEAVTKRANDIGAKRIVLDSSSMLGMMFESRYEFRRKLYELVKAFKGIPAVTLMTAEILEGDAKALSRFGVEEFLVDGVILLSYLSIGKQASRTLMVRKMRRTDHGADVYPLVITGKGIEVKAAEDKYKL